MSGDKNWTYFFRENLSYKIIALLIALILWFTILGRRDFITHKSIEIDLISGEGRSVVSQSTEQIKLKVSGPRTAVKKFTESAMSNSITIDLSDRSEGPVEIEIPLKKLDLPLGLKIVSIRPNTIKARIEKNGKTKNENH